MYDNTVLKKTELIRLCMTALFLGNTIDQVMYDNTVLKKTQLIRLCMTALCLRKHMWPDYL